MRQEALIHSLSLCVCLSNARPSLPHYPAPSQVTIGGYENVKYHTDTIVDSGGIGVTLYAEELAGDGGDGVVDAETANDVDHGGGGGGSDSGVGSRLSPLSRRPLPSPSPMMMTTRFLVEESPSAAPTPPVRVANRLKKRFDVSPVVENPSASFPNQQDSVNSETPNLFVGGDDDEMKIDGEELDDMESNYDSSLANLM